MAQVFYAEHIPKSYLAIRESAKEYAHENFLLIHDLYAFDPKAQLSFLERWKEKKWIKKHIRSTESIFVWSEFTGDELTRIFPEAKSKISIQHPLPNPAYTQTDEDARDAIRYQNTEGDAYFIYKGPIHPAANIISLLKGFSIFKKRIGSNMKMVLCGPQGNYSADILDALEYYKYKKDVLLFPQSGKWEEQSLISSAYALIHPCPYERFGIPVFNAMKAGVPVLTVENSSMSEFCGMAGMYFNPLEPEDIGEKLILIYNDEQIRSEMIGTGLVRTS